MARKETDRRSAGRRWIKEKINFDNQPVSDNKQQERDEYLMEEEPIRGGKGEPDWGE